MPAQFTVLHRDARALLVHWQAPNAAMAAIAARMLQVLDADPTAMWREHSPVHFTGSLLLFSPGLDRVALTLHGKAKRWFQFGGHFEEGDTSVADGARREGEEESGSPSFTMLPQLVAVDAHTLSKAFGRCAEHLDLRFAAIATSNDLLVSDESDDVRWWPVDALPGGSEPELIDAVTLGIAACR